MDIASVEIIVQAFRGNRLFYTKITTVKLIEWWFIYWQIQEILKPLAQATHQRLN